MGLFDLFKIPDINKGIQEYSSMEKAVLLDVRNRAEYEKRHIPGAINIPLDSIEQVKERIPGTDVPVYVYCYTGRRSRKAAAALKKMGYINAKNIGGIMNYKG